MKFAIINLLVLIIMVIGIISTSTMNIFWLLGELILWSFVHLFLLRNDWKYLFNIFRKGFIVFMMLLFILSIYVIFNANSFLISLVKIMSIGIISILFLVPVITDSFLISINKISFLRIFFEAFILIRNFVSGLVDDLFLGILTAPKFKESSFITKVKFIGLATFTLIARAPDITTNLLVSTKISKFETIHLKAITNPSKGLYISLGLALFFFTTYLVHFYGN